ncbi:MAG: hypothetical protein ACYDD5_00705 [Sulfuricurvum sp.]
MPWTPIQADFTGSSRAANAALDAGTNAAAAWGNLAKDIATQKRQEALDVQNKLIFDQQQDDRARALDERAAKDILAKGLVEGPQTTYRDINDDVLKGKAFNYGDVGLFENKDASGKSTYTTEAGGAGRLLSPEEVALRQQQQIDIGKVLDTPEASKTELQSEMYSRLLGDISGQGKVVTPELAGLLQTARAADVTAKDAKVRGVQELLSTDEKELTALEKDYRKVLTDAGVANKFVDMGATTQASSEEVGKLKATQDEYKSKLGGLGKAGGVDTLLEHEKNVVGSFDKLFNSSDNQTAKAVREHIMANKLNPELATNVMKLYTDDGFVTNSFTADAPTIIAAIDAAAEGDADKFNKATGTSSSSMSTTVRDVRLMQSVNPAVTKQYEKDKDELLKRISTRKAEMTKLGLTGPAKDQAEQEALSKDIQDILSRGLSKPAEKAIAKVESKGTAEPKATTSILSPAITGRTANKGVKASSKSTTKDAAKTVLPEPKKTVSELSPKEKATYDKWKADFEKDGQGLESSALDPISWIGGAKIAQKSLEKIASTAPAVAALLEKSPFGRKITSLLGKHAPTKVAPAEGAAKLVEKARLENLANIAKKTANRKASLGNSQLWADEVAARGARDAVLAKPRGGIPQGPIIEALKRK